MNTTTKTRAPKGSKVLMPQTIVDEQAAIAAQTTARESNTAAIRSAVETIIAEYQATVDATEVARSKVLDAEKAQRTKLENTYLALAELAHKHELDTAMSRDLLTTALGAYYPKDQFDIAVSTASKLRSQLLRAMQEKVRGALPTILKPWVDAWDAETAAIAADANAATPLRDKFDNRGGLVTQAIGVALGSKKGKEVIPSYVATNPADVLTWVKEHPRQKRGATAPNGTTPSTEAAKAATAAGAGLSPMDAASAKVDALIAAVKAVSVEYNDPDCFVAVLEALAKCTAKMMIREPAPKAAPTVATVEAAEPASGIVDMDDLLRRELEIIQKLTRK